MENRDFVTKIKRQHNDAVVFLRGEDKENESMYFLDHEDDINHVSNNTNIVLKSYNGRKYVSFSEIDRALSVIVSSGKKVALCDRLNQS